MITKKIEISAEKKEGYSFKTSALHDLWSLFLFCCSCIYSKHRVLLLSMCQSAGPLMASL